MVKKLILVVMLLALGITSAFGSSLRLDSSTTTPAVIKPGDEVDLTLRVQNMISGGQDPVYSYILEIEPKNNLARDNLIILKSEDNLGRLGVNEFWNARFKFKVMEGAPSATYELNVNIHRYLGSTLVSTTQASYSFEVIGETFFQIDSDDKSISQGETKTFRAIIRNVGGSNAGSVTLTFGNTENIRILGTNTFYFDNIRSNEEREFDITLNAQRDIPSGTYNFPVTITYNDGTEIRTQDIQAGVLVGGNVDLRVAAVQTTPREVRPGDNYVLVSLNLENAGEDDARAVSAHLTSDYFRSSYSDDNNVFAGRIDSSSYSNLKFYIDVPRDTKSGVYHLDLNLEYKNMLGDDFNRTLKVPFHVKDKPILVIKSVEAVGKAGSTIPVRIVVENLGEQNAEEVDIRLISDSSLPFTIEERSVYLGSVGANGGTATAMFNIRVASDAEIKDYNIRAFIRARGDSEVGDNNIYTFNRDVNIEIDGKAINKLALAGIIIAVLVALGLIFRNKLKPTASQKKKIKKD